MQRLTMPSPLADIDMMLEDLSVGVAIFEASTFCLLAANAAYQSLLEPMWQEGRAIGHSLVEICPPAEVDGAIALFHRLSAMCMRSEPDLAVSAQFFHRSAYWNWTLSPIYDQAGQVMHLLLTVNKIPNQIIDQRQAERGQREIAELSVQGRKSGPLSQERYRVMTILDHLPEGIILVEATSSIVSYANSVAAQMLGLALIDLVGQPLNRSVPSRPDLSSSRPPLVEWNFALIRALSGKTIHSQECQVTRPDGSKAIVLCSAAPLLTQEGSIAEAVLVFQDITAQKSLEQQKNDFFAIANHELRTPLTAIMGFAELLQFQATGELDAFQQDAISSILQEGEHLRQLVHDLLDVSSLDYAQLDLKRTTSDLLTLLQQQIRAAAQSTRTHQISLTLHEIDSIRSLMGWIDPLRFKQIIGNLLSNAIKYSPAGSPIDVAVQPFRDASGIIHEVQISVKDQGIGIEVSDLPHVFERFYRASTLDAAISGFGVGLYLTKALVQSHKGQIWVESTKGQGSTFFVLLPLEHQEDA
jgi:PAS domain S-box-containing protein